jgi:hypothetical protein
MSEEMSQEFPWFSKDMIDLHKIQSKLFSLQRYINSEAQTLPEDKKKYLTGNMNKACNQYPDFRNAERTVKDLPRYLPEDQIDGNLKQVRDYSSKIEELEQKIRDEISERVRILLWDLLDFRRKFPEQFPHNILYNPDARPSSVQLNQYFVSYAHRLVK